MDIPTRDVTIHYVDGHIVFKMTEAEYQGFVVYMNTNAATSIVFGDLDEEHYLLRKENICFVHTKSIIEEN